MQTPIASLSTFSATALSLSMLAGFLLLGGGLWLLVRGKGGMRERRRHGWLMIIAALVMFGNVAIWAIPVGDGARVAMAPAR